MGDAVKLKTGEPYFRFIDLFAGIGGCRMAFERAGGECVFTSEWDDYARKTYETNFPSDEGSDHVFRGDITTVHVDEIPEHDVLVGGFPCQPFSIAGVSKKNALGRPHGFADPTQGTLFFDVARIIEHKRPKAFLLENVRNLVSHDKGNTFRVIKEKLESLDYSFDPKVVDASVVVPQGRKRIFMVGFDKRVYGEGVSFNFDEVKFEAPVMPNPTMETVLYREDGTEQVELPYTDEYGRVAEKYTLTPRLWEYLQNYKKKHNAAGNGFGFGLVTRNDVARTLSARYYKDGSEILVDQGEGKRPRRLTPRECARLMGFPNNFVIPVSDTRAYKQFGNSVVVPVVEGIAKQIAANLVELEAGIREAG